MKLSVVMPIYNERSTLEEVVAKVLGVPLEIELICVDDGSSDGSREMLRELDRSVSADDRTFCSHTTWGKVLRFDAEYRRRLATTWSFRTLIWNMTLISTLYCWSLFSKEKPMLFLDRASWEVVLIAFYISGTSLPIGRSRSYRIVSPTSISVTWRLATNVFRREIIQAIPIEENRFGFEPEITVKVAKRHLRIYEVGISYWGRTYEEGKKIGWKDGVRALWCLVKYSIKEPVYRTPNRSYQYRTRTINN